ncbi:DinB family protein [Micromonospora sp. BRA006-A]|nr:DinB family protein [Micromonospora sp. BRA006-A]
MTDVLTEAYGRLPDLVAGALDGLDEAQLRRAPADGANPVGWLVWHLTRIQDDHVADVMGCRSCGPPATGRHAAASRRTPPTPASGTARSRSPRYAPRTAACCWTTTGRWWTEASRTCAG